MQAAVLSAAEPGRWSPLQIKTPAENLDPLGGGEGEQHPRSIARSVSSPEILYAGIDTGGTWRSADHGVTWIKNPDDGLYGKGIQSISIDPRNPLTVYVFSEITTSNGSEMTTMLESREGIYRSADGGATWSLVKAIPNPVNSENGNYRLHRQLMTAMPQDDGATIWYACFDGSGIWKITDPNQPGQPPVVAEAPVAPDPETELYYSLAHYRDGTDTCLLYGSVKGLFRRRIADGVPGPAEDLGVPAGDAPPVLTDPATGDPLPADQQYKAGITSLYVNPANPDEVWASRRWDRPYRTLDARAETPRWVAMQAMSETGASLDWESLGAYGRSGAIMCVTPYHTVEEGAPGAGAPEPSRGFLAMTYHVFHLTRENGQPVWKRYRSGSSYNLDFQKRPALLSYRKATIGPHCGFVFHPQNPDDIAAYGQSTFWRTTTGGIPSDTAPTWRQTGYGHTGFAVQNGLNGVTIDAANPSVKWFPWNDVGIARTTDNGAGFEPLGNIPVMEYKPGPEEFYWRSAANVAVNPANPSIMISAIGIYGANKFKIARSADGGASWLPASANATHRMSETGLGAGLFADVMDGGVRHTPAFMGRFFATDDEAANWEPIAFQADRDERPGYEAPNPDKQHLIIGGSDGSGARTMVEPTLYAARTDGYQEILRGEPDPSKASRFRWFRVFNQYNRGIKHPAGSVVAAVSPANRNILFGAMRDTDPATKAGTEYAQKIARFDFTGKTDSSNPSYASHSMLPRQPGGAVYNNINALAPDPENDRIVYVATAAPGLPCVFKVTFAEGGPAAAEDLTANMPRIGVNSLTHDPADGGRLLASGFHGTWVLPLAARDAYEVFLADHGLEMAGDGGPLEDPDGDGYSNLLEYATAGNPVDAASANRPRMDADGGAFRFTSIADPLLTYEVWASENLADWGGAPVWSSSGAANVDGEVAVPVPETGERRRFHQLRVRR